MFTRITNFSRPLSDVRALLALLLGLVVRSEVLAEDLERVRSEAVDPVEGVVVVELDLDPEVLLLLLGDGVATNESRRVDASV
eukprot:SAG22_NODE_479_length_9968_cov_43.841524_3_plen_83_part_00